MVNIIMIIACVVGLIIDIGAMVFLVKKLKKESDNLNNLSLRANLSFSDYIKTILLFIVLIATVLIAAVVIDIILKLL